MPYTFGRDNRPCDGASACLPGYVCDLSRNLCVLSHDAECAASGTCQTPNPMPCPDANLDGMCDAPSCPDADADGVCDDLDTCVDVDQDGLGNGTGDNSGCMNVATDNADGDAHSCADTDDDTCDDCESGGFAPTNDGVDANGDGICHAIQPDEDGDGVGWAQGDVDDSSATRCEDADDDQCDDCTNGLPPNPANDGPDFDGNGQCDFGDPDDDKDGVLDAEDDDNENDHVCQDVDSDGCDDCARDGAAHPWNDGTDDDRDGLCVSSAAGADCDDAIPTCLCPSCTATDECVDSASDGDTLPECVERFCTSTRADPDGVTDGTCTVVTTPGELAGIAGSTGGPAHILIDASFTVTGTGDPFSVTDGKIIHQRMDTFITVDRGSDHRLFEVIGDNNELHGLRVQPCQTVGCDSNLTSVIVITGNNNAVVDSLLRGMKNRGIFLDGASSSSRVQNTYLARNIITVMATTDVDDGNASDVDEGGIVLEYTSNTRLLRNIISLNHPGIVLANAVDTTLDHNTVRMFGSAGSDAGSNAIAFISEASSGTCMRNNLLTNLQSAPASALVYYETATTNNAWHSTCTSAGNVLSSAKRCEKICVADAAMDDCTCVADGISSVSFDPATDFTDITTSTLPGYRCLDNPNLIDNSAFALIDDAGKVGAFPEPGAREANTPECPPNP